MESSFCFAARFSYDDRPDVGRKGFLASCQFLPGPDQMPFVPFFDGDAASATHRSSSCPLFGESRHVVLPMLSRLPSYEMVQRSEKELSWVSADFKMVGEE